MPCHDGPPPPFTLYEAREQIDRLTRYMCESIYLLQRCSYIALHDAPQPHNATNHLSLQAQQWARRQKGIDEQRKYVEANFKATREGALAKLTKLGVGDWNMKESE